MSWKRVLLIILQMLPAHSRCWAVGQQSSGAPQQSTPPRLQEHPAFLHIRNQQWSIWAATDGLHRCHIINTELAFTFKNQLVTNSTHMETNGPTLETLALFLLYVG